jgi:hypothetical protein
MDWKLIAKVLGGLVIGLIMYAYQADKNHMEYRQNQLEKEMSELKKGVAMRDDSIK